MMICWLSIQEEREKNKKNNFFCFEDLKIFQNQNNFICRVSNLSIYLFNTELAIKYKSFWIPVDVTFLDSFLLLLLFFKSSAW